MGITDPEEAYFQSGGWGWDLTQWRKLALSWGYTDRLALKVTHTMVGTGNYNLSAVTVPAGYVYVIQAVVSWNAGSATTQIHTLNDGVYNHPIASFSTPAAGVYNIVDNLSYTLKEGDQVIAQFLSCSNADVLSGAVWGYKMAVAE